ncbi:MAG: tetraacyldisaccharide 4'-kinase [Acidobacteriota bacterium]
MNGLAAAVLSPLSGLYGVAMKARRAFYRRGWLRQESVPAPLISVGNLTMGGTGKTPLVEWIAVQLAAANRHVCILTRGYGREQPQQRVVVSNRTEILSDARHAGDEALLLAENLQQRAAVISDVDRTSAALWAMKNLGSDVFVLDDGFQNLGLARNLDIVTIDATNPWGNRRLLPAGILREPPRGLSRADCVVITRIDEADDLQGLEREIRELGAAQHIFHSRMRIRGLRVVNASVEGVPTDIKEVPLAAFCGIGNPQSFFTQLRAAGYQLGLAEIFRDHHVYTQADVDRLIQKARAAGLRALLTTAKDEVKLRALTFDLPCFAVEIGIEIEEEDQFRVLIENSFG